MRTNPGSITLAFTVMPERSFCTLICSPKVPSSRAVPDVLIDTPLRFASIMTALPLDIVNGAFNIGAVIIVFAAILLLVIQLVISFELVK